MKTEDFSDLEKLIAQHLRMIEEYKQRQRVAYDNRKRNPVAWRRFCEQPRPHSPLYDYMMRFENPADIEATTFAMRFLALDPWFDQSGYIKEYFLHKLKKRQLTQKHIDYLNDILLDAVEHRGQREFRRYCRLARKIATSTLTHHLEVMVNYAEPSARRSRAKLMLQTIRTKQEQ